MRNRTAPLLALLLGWAALTGCDPTRRVAQDQRLLKKNLVTVDRSGLNVEAMQAIAKQKPNKKILFFRFYLQAYNWPDPTKLEERQARKNAKRDRKNQKRVAKGKEPKPYKGNWWRDVVGEAPVVIDSGLVRRSEEQMRLYLFKEGYFDAQVRDTIHLNRKRIKPFTGRGRPYKRRWAEVEYVATAGKPYHLRNITFTVDDPTMLRYLFEDTAKTLLHRGDRFRSDVLDEERNRVVAMYRQLGYLYFTRDLIVYDADTTAGDREVDVTLRIERPRERSERGLRGTPEGTYYYLNDVTIRLGMTGRKVQPASIDTVEMNGYRVVYIGEEPLYKPPALLDAVFFAPGDRYEQEMNDRTYRRFTNLRVFDRVDITYDTLGVGGHDRVNCVIDLIPSKRQSMSVEGFGTNRGGLLGVQGSVSFTHRNLFRSMTSMQTSLTVGLEAQQSVTGGSDPTDEASTAVGRDVLFNTIEIGPEVTFRFPYFLLPLRRSVFSRSSTPRTVVNVLYSFQRRPDYTRTVAKGSFGWEWNDTRTKTWGVYPLELNVVKIPTISAEFEQYIIDSNDPVLRDSYTDHLIVGPRAVFTWNTQPLGIRRNTYFAKVVGSESGLGMYAISKTYVDPNGSQYERVAGIRFAEFVKLEGDIRWYHTIHSRSNTAFRVAGGVGVPYGNLTVLPFESSFFVGGANGLRAWRARSVGPGSYSAPLEAYDRTGEVRLEANAEYRFKLIGYLEGALFVDLGNVWYLEEDPLRPGSGFEGDFINELAVGTGIGARFNFDFFLIRFDFGLQTKDPSLPNGERWIFQPKERYESEYEVTYGSSIDYRPEVNFNLGIGYPF